MHEACSKLTYKGTGRKLQVNVVDVNVVNVVCHWSVIFIVAGTYSTAAMKTHIPDFFLLVCVVHVCCVLADDHTYQITLDLPQTGRNGAKVSG